MSIDSRTTPEKGRQPPASSLMAHLRLVAVLVLPATLTALVVLEPRLRHGFPSMIDDWSAIAYAPEQLREVLRGGNPESLRYRPGFIAWNALQWHTLGAPQSFVGPQLWNALRVLLFIVGTTGVTYLLTVPRKPGEAAGIARWLVVALVAPLLVTVPAFAVDFARFGPQEPLLVGCICSGGVVLTIAMQRILAGAALVPMTALGALGAVLIAAGTLQKETSLCFLLLVPFLWLAARTKQRRFGQLPQRSRVVLASLTLLASLAFIPMFIRTLQLVRAGDLVYDAQLDAGTGLARRVKSQLTQAASTLDTRTGTIAVAAVLLLLVLVLVLRRSVDWISIGLLAAASGFILFAAQSGVVVSRYYLPALSLVVIVLGRLACRLGQRPALAAAGVMALLTLIHIPTARTAVVDWVGFERQQESIVREAAARAAGGCEVRVTGLNVELVVALPVLMPLAKEPPRGCSSGERFVVVIDGKAPGDRTSPDDPVLAACLPATEVAAVGKPPEGSRSPPLARVLRCRR